MRWSLLGRCHGKSLAIYIGTSSSIFWFFVRLGMTCIPGTVIRWRLPYNLPSLQESNVLTAGPGERINWVPLNGGGKMGFVRRCTSTSLYCTWYIQEFQWMGRTVMANGIWNVECCYLLYVSYLLPSPAIDSKDSNLVVMCTCNCSVGVPGSSHSEVHGKLPAYYPKVQACQYQNISISTISFLDYSCGHVERIGRSKHLHNM